MEGEELSVEGVMNFAMRLLLMAVAVTLLCGRSSSAVVMLLKIDSPEQCPEGVTISSKARDGMIQFDVAIDPEQVAHAGELYKGRVRSSAFLDIVSGQEKVAFVSLDGNTEKNQTRYFFRLSPAAVKSSELQLGVSLYEKDGHPTVGGGVSLQIKLAGFEPKPEQKK